MPPSSRDPSLKGQIATCLLFVALAVTITTILHPTPKFSEWKVGLPLGLQFAVAATFLTLGALGAVIALQFARLRRAYFSDRGRPFQSDRGR